MGNMFLYRLAAMCNRFRFLWTLRGHVQRAYLVSWSADSRLLVSCSADSTVKVWDIKAKDRKLLHDLPGHEDQVYKFDTNDKEMETILESQVFYLVVQSKKVLTTL